MRDRVVLLTDDEGGVAGTLAEELGSRGIPVAVAKWGERVETTGEGRYAANLASAESVSQLLDTVRRRQGPIGGLVHLLPLKKHAAFAEMDLQGWRERLRLETKALFLLARGLKGDLEDAARGERVPLVAATAMGGAFAQGGRHDGNGFFPGQGGIHGVLKTIAQEWPDVHVEAVDLNPDEPAPVLAAHLLEDIVGGGDEVEVGYDGAHRLTLEPVPAPLDRGGSASLQIDSSWVIVITGGARGITAEVACELAQRYQPTLVLVGRSPLPEPVEPEETEGLTSVQLLKAAIMARMRSQGLPVTPARVEEVHARLLVDREIRRNLAAMRRAGADVHYHQADVRDERALGGVIDEVYRSFGRLDGVIHGAGVIEDRLVEAKTPESFDRVFDTKVDSAFILSRRLHPDSLRFLVFFSSIAGCFGNRGQADYAAANEVLNKLALYLDRHWPGRVVSVNWGPWAKSGMVSKELQKRFEERGVGLIEPSVGRRKLADELCYGRKGEVEVIVGGGRLAASAERPLRSPAPRAFALVAPSPASSFNHLPDGSVELVRKLDPDHDLYLRDHQLDGRPVLPVAMAMELLAETAAEGWPDQEVVALEDVRVLHGIVLEQGAETIRVVARPHARVAGEPLTVEAEILGSERAHYRATVELAEKLPDPPPVAPLELAEERPFPMSVDEAYRLWLFQGPLFRGITEVDGVGTDGIRARLAGSTPERWLASAPRGRWIFDPALVDSGLQLLILWVRETWDMTPLPSRILRCRRFAGENASSLRGELHVRPHSRGHVLIADIVLRGADDRVVAIIEGVEGACTKALNRLVGNAR